jgi:hypothetical protein
VSRFSLRRPQGGALRSGLKVRSTRRLSACSVAMRANSTGPPCSAAAVNISAAVRTAGKRRSAAGIVLTRCAMDSRRDVSLAPSGQHDGGRQNGYPRTRRNSATEPGFKQTRGWLVPEDQRSLAEKRPQLREGLEPSYLGLCRGAAQHDGTMRPQSADASKFYFREAHFLLARRPKCPGLFAFPPRSSHQSLTCP